MAFLTACGLAVLVDEHRVEVVDLAEAVAAERQRVDQRAEVVLAAVEGVLADVRRRRIAVRHDHLRHRRAMQDRAQRCRRPRSRRVCSTSPSRGVNPTRNRHFCQRTS